MIGLDTNVLLRWLMHDAPSGGDAPHQVDLIETLVVNADEGIFINRIVVGETAWVLRRWVHIATNALVVIAARLLNLANIIFQKRDMLLAALASYDRYPADFSDQSIGTINKHNGCRTTLTFDRAAARSLQFSELQR